jgi:hypothetical protein
VTSESEIRKGQPVVVLATEDIINVEGAAVAGVDYKPVTGNLEFEQSEGLIHKGSKSNPLEVVTYPNGGGKEFMIVVNDIVQVKNLVDIEPSSRTLSSNVKIDQLGAIHATSYNCAQPLRYVSDGKTGTKAEIKLGYNNFPTRENEFVIPVEIDVSECFEGDVIRFSYSTDTGAQIAETGSRLELSNTNLNWFDQSQVELSVSAESAAGIGASLTITVGLDLTNSFSIENLEEVRLNVLDYWSGEVAGLSRDVFQQVNGLQCKFYASFSEGAGYVGGDVDCCEADGDTLEIKSCFQADYDNFGPTGAQLQFQSVAAGKSYLCIGSTQDAKKCFSVISADQLAMLAPIPDQYVVVNNDGWSVEVDAVSTDMGADFEVLSPVEVDVTTTQNKILIKGEAGQSGQQFSISVVFIAHKKMQRDTSNTLKETVGTTFKITVL